MNRVLVVLAMAVLAVFVVLGSTSPASANQCPRGYAGISSTTSTTNSITVNWAEPSLNDGAVIDGYYVFWRTGQGAWDESLELGPSARSWTITNLTPGTNYEVYLGYRSGGIKWHCGVLFYSSTDATPEPATVELRIKKHEFMYGLVDGEEIQKLVNSTWHIRESQGQGGWFDIAAHMSPAPTVDTKFTLEIAGYGDNQPTKDVDYEYAPTSPLSFTVPVGKTESEVKRIQFRFRCDHLVDPGERISLRLVGDTITSGYMLIEIEDDCAPPPAVRFMESSYSGSEGDSVAVTLASERIIDRLYTVSVTAHDGTGSADDDIKTKSWNVTFPGGVGLVTFYAEIEEDSVFEPSPETIKLRIGVGSGYSVGSPGESTVTIAAETPDPVVIRMNPTMYTVTEGVDNRVVMTVATVDGPAVQPIPFTVTVSDAVTDEHVRIGDQKTRASGETPTKNRGARARDDYTDTIFYGTIEAGESSAIAHFPLIDDQIAEIPEQVYGELETDAESVTVTSGVVLISILDNDVVNIKPDQSYLEAGEFSGNANLTVRMSRAFDANRTITLAFSTDDSTIAVVEPATVEVSGADWNDPITVTVKAVSDSDYETELTNVNVGLEHASVMVQMLGNKIPMLVPDTDLARLPETEICSNNDACKGSYYAGPAIGQLGVGMLSPRIYLSEPAPRGGVTFRIRQLGGSDVTLFEQQVTVPQGAQNIIYNATLPRNGDTFRIEVTPTDISWVRAWDGADVAILYGVGSTGGL